VIMSGCLCSNDGLYLPVCGLFRLPGWKLKVGVFDFSCLFFKLPVCNIERSKDVCVGKLRRQCFNEGFYFRIVREILFQILDIHKQMGLAILNF